MSDLVSRLRQYRGEQWETTECYNGLRDEAADRLEAAEAENARLKEMLEGRSHHFVPKCRKCVIAFLRAWEPSNDACVALLEASVERHLLSKPCLQAAAKAEADRLERDRGNG